MGFSEILGHGKQIQSFRSALRNGRLHHAYLFLGPEGIGKRTIALAVAKAIQLILDFGPFASLKGKLWILDCFFRFHGGVQF